MCAVPGVMAALAATSALTGAATMVAQGQAQRRQSAYQSAVAQANAAAADQAAQAQEQAAERALQQGRVAEQQQRLRTAQAVSSQRAGQAASGVLVDSGSALDVTADTAQAGELDALSLRQQAEEDAYQHRWQAYQARTGGNAALAQGQLGSIRGQSAVSGSLFAVGNSLLSRAPAVGRAFGRAWLPDDLS